MTVIVRFHDDLYEESPLIAGGRPAPAERSHGAADDGADGLFIVVRGELAPLGPHKRFVKSIGPLPRPVPVPVGGPGALAARYRDAVTGGLRHELVRAVDWHLSQFYVLHYDDDEIGVFNYSCTVEEACRPGEEYVGLVPADQAGWCP